MKKSLTVIIVLLIALALFWVYQNKSGKLSTGGFEIYRSDRYGFEFSYPKDLVIKETEDPITAEISDILLISQSSDVRRIDLEDSCENEPSYIELEIVPDFENAVGRSYEESILNQESNFALQGGRKVSDVTVGSERRIIFEDAKPYNRTYSIYNTETDMQVNMTIRECGKTAVPPIDEIASTFKFVK